MRAGIFAIVAMLACTNPEPKPIVAEKPLNPAIESVVQFLADSVAPCKTWLMQDSKPRRFFTANDSLAGYLTNHFSHDQLLAWFQSIDSTSRMDLSPYLIALDIPMLRSADSLTNCANAVNAIAFSHPQTEALVLFVTQTPQTEEVITLLLERPTTTEPWYVADTLWQQTNQPSAN